LDATALIQTLQDLDGTSHVRAQIDWGQFGGLIAAVGALGVASFGVVEALGKALTIVYQSRPERAGKPVTIRLGLPYVGFSVVRRMTRPLAPALACAYGVDYLDLIAQQYRADRSHGRAPDMVREGVKLGLPFLPLTTAAEVIGAVWSMEPARATALAAALQADGPPPARRTAKGDAADMQSAQLLAGRFATALDERVNAAFLLAEERYEAYAKMLSGAAAVILAVVFNMSLQPRFPWWVAALVGVIAVPLAPVAKDLSSSLQNALTAFKSIPTRRA
jgi:hypothetical protein